MPDFTVKCEIYYRIAHCAVQPDDPDDSLKRQYLRSVKIERKNNALFASATNAWIMAIEHVVDAPGPDGSVNVTIDAQLIDACRRGSDAGETMTVMFDPSTQWATAMLSGGYIFPGNAAISGVWSKDWREIINAAGDKSDGAASFRADDFARLAAASPSGFVVMPRIIDRMRPVLVRDMIDPDWLGAFVSLKKDDGSYPNPAEIPTWAKK